jgi:hypothetical protein
MPLVVKLVSNWTTGLRLLIGRLLVTLSPLLADTVTHLSFDANAVLPSD